MVGGLQTSQTGLSVDSEDLGVVPSLLIRTFTVLGGLGGLFRNLTVVIADYARQTGPMKRLLLLTTLLVTPALAGDLGLHDQGSYEKYCQREFKADRRSLILGMGKNAKLTFTPELMKVGTDEGTKNRLIKKDLIDINKFGDTGIAPSQVISFDKYEMHGQGSPNTKFSIYYETRSGKKDLAIFYFMAWKKEEISRFQKTFLTWVSEELDSCPELPSEEDP